MKSLSSTLQLVVAVGLIGFANVVHADQYGLNPWVGGSAQSGGDTQLIGGKLYYRYELLIYLFWHPVPGAVAYDLRTVGVPGSSRVTKTELLLQASYGPDGPPQSFFTPCGEHGFGGLFDFFYLSFNCVAAASQNIEIRPVFANGVGEWTSGAPTLENRPPIMRPFFAELFHDGRAAVQARGALLSYQGRPIDPDQPTFVYSHGFISDPTKALEIAAALRARFPDANILVWDWQESASLAHGLSPIIDSEVTSQQAYALANDLEEAGVDLATLQLVGHSMGGVLVAKAAELLHENTGVKVNEVLLLDSPFFLTVDLKVADYANRVESLTSRFGAPNIAKATNISILNEPDHGAPIDDYIDRIKTGRPLLSGLPPGVYGAPDGIFEPMLLIDVDYTERELGIVAVNPTDTDLHESSPSSTARTFVMPANVRYLSFDTIFQNPGDGDYLVVSWNDDALLIMGGDTPGPNQKVSSGAIDISRFAGQAGILEFALYSAGERNADFRISNIALGGAATVSLAVTAPFAEEHGATPARFNVTRTGSHSLPLAVHYSVSGTATNGIDYASLPGAVIIPAGSDSVSLEVVPLADSLAEGDEAVEITILPAMTYAVAEAQATATIHDSPAGVWRQQRFGPNANDPNIGGLSADPDYDRLSNFVEYALGLDPNAADSDSSPRTAFQTVGDQDYFAITFRRRKAPTDVSYQIETSDDLQTWSMGALIQSVGVIDHGDGTETVSYRDTVPKGQIPTRFYRLRLIGS